MAPKARLRRWSSSEYSAGAPQVGSGIALGVEPARLALGLEAFTGVERRFQRIADVAGVSIVDDYAHHPTEIVATIEAARSAFPGRRLIVAFQPHLYSRTRDFADGFGRALAGADVVFLTELYPAREQPIPGVNVSDMIHRIARLAPEKTLLYLPDKHDLIGALNWIAQTGDVILTMGAGDIREVGEDFATSLKQQNSNEHR